MHDGQILVKSLWEYFILENFNEAYTSTMQGIEGWAWATTHNTTFILWKHIWPTCGYHVTEPYTQALLCSNRNWNCNWDYHVTESQTIYSILYTKYIHMLHSHHVPDGCMEGSHNSYSVVDGNQSHSTRDLLWSMCDGISNLFTGMHMNNTLLCIVSQCWSYIEQKCERWVPYYSDWNKPIWDEYQQGIILIV